MCLTQASEVTIFMQLAPDIYKENEREKSIYLFTFSLGIKETVLIWILELEVVKSQITI